MNRLQKTSLAIILALAFVLTGCADSSLERNRDFNFTTPAYANGEPETGETIKIASFNIQVFGKTKASKPEVMDILADIISQFDLVAIQEIRDKSGTAIVKLEQAVDNLGEDYTVIIGPRLGRTSCKEQYAFTYRTDKFNILGSYTYDDHLHDVFHREPFVAHFQAKSGTFDFLVLSIHTDPDMATEEINALPMVISDAIQHFSEHVVIALGDYYSDCSYFDEDTITTVFPASGYMSLIPNSADTTVKGTVCTYDRIIITTQAEEDYDGNCGVYRFDTVHGLSQDKADDVSDHYPVWAEFYVGRDTE